MTVARALVDDTGADAPLTPSAQPCLARNSFGQTQPLFLEFFAGSGLVASGVAPYFQPAWANDICEKKAAVYTSNHGNEHFHLGSIENVNGSDLPAATLSWASFPCQDLSLAGLIAGIHGKRSGLVWEWLRIMEEMPRTPPLLVAENVTGLVSVDNGAHYRALHEALRSRGYKVGAIVLDAIRWVPQSRPRVFVIAVKNEALIPEDLMAPNPTWLHTNAVIKAAAGLEDWVYWNMPEPSRRNYSLADIVEWEAECDSPDTIQRNVGLIPDRHRERLNKENVIVAAGYKRTRQSKQVLELRFDGVAGCLRTPKGGSSRQFLVLKHGDQLKTRLLTVRETARLMGAPDSFELPGSYNEGYKAMGDAVAMPVANYLASHLLSPLAQSLR